MKIRFAFTLTIRRDDHAEPAPKTREFQGAYIENAGMQPIGFVIPSTSRGDD